MKRTLLSIRVIAIFALAIGGTVLGQYLGPLYLGDWTCSGSGTRITDGLISSHWTGCTYGIEDYYHGPETHWGWAHWLYLLMGLALFILQVVWFIKDIDDK